MDTPKFQSRLSDYGLTEKEVARLKAEGKDSWYHLKVLQQLKGFTAKQEVPDKAFSFRNGPKYQLSKVDWRSPTDLHVAGDVGVDAIETWTETEMEQSMKLARRILMKDPNFSVGFVPVGLQETTPSMPETPKSPPPDSQSQHDGSADGSTRSGSSHSEAKLESPFKYQPNLLKRKPTCSPPLGNEQKHPRLDSLDVATTHGKEDQSPFVGLPTPDESRHSSPLVRSQQRTECQQLSPQSRTWLLKSVLIREYNGRSNPFLFIPGIMRYSSVEQIKMFMHVVSKSI